MFTDFLNEKCRGSKHKLNVGDHIGSHIILGGIGDMCQIFQEANTQSLYSVSLTNTRPLL